MAYVVRCRYCNHYFFGVVRRWLEETMIEHICDNHPNEDVVYSIVRVSDELYGDYLKNRDNPRFWQALRLCRKQSKIPLFV